MIKSSKSLGPYQENHITVRRHYNTNINTTNFFDLRVVQWKLLQQ